MIICFKCKPETKNQLDELVSRGSYSDYADVISAAIHNLLVLQEELGNGRSLVLGGATTQSQPSHSTTDTQPTADQNHAEASGPGEVEVSSDPIRLARDLAGIPAAFRRPENDAMPASLAPMPTDVFFHGQAVPLDRWIFGQYSKLLPAKASIRAFAAMYPPKGIGFELDKTASRIAKEAAALGRFLAARDEREGARDDSFAVGFPSEGENADKSRLRYANQFVGSISKQGTLVGLLIDLKLINLAKTGSKHVLLTNHGWDFALLRSPLLDEGATDRKFSDEEIAFLLDHISRRVPAEAFAFRAILSAIREGENTPEKLDQICRTHIAPGRTEALSDAFITTQRTGVISRLADLSLVVRRRDGVRVSYELTDLGTDYVNRPAAA